MTEDEVTALMGAPATHGGAEVAVVRTHGARVFLTGPWAYKVKRAVRYPYLDFTAATTRRAMLARELELNRPAAPQIYDRLLPLTRERDGRLALDGSGHPEEWVLRMHRFDADAQLTRVAAEGRLDAGLAAALGDVVAGLHRAAQPPDPGRRVVGAAAVAAVIDGMAVSFARLAGVLGPDGGAFLGAARAALARHAGLLDRRAAQGWVRRCHGDLHLGNLVLVAGRPVPFDALEFDEALATTDVLYDLAFLLMDLDRAGCREAANIVLNRWLHRMDDPAHLDGLALLPLFVGLRAGIRAMVAAQTAPGPDARADARAALAVARACLAPPSARLVAVGGLSGSGKSTLAARLAPAIGPAPGAVVLRSDLVRKAMAGVGDTERLPPEAYTRAASDAVYAELRTRAGRALAAGHGVVLDAVHLAPAERAAVAGLARRAGVACRALWLDTPAERLLARVAARRGDASDADTEVVRAQIAAAQAVTDWPHLDGAGTPDTVARAARIALGLPEIARPAPLHPAVPGDTVPARSGDHTPEEAR
ncbi:AAA family ATPase [Rhodobaculum claviforme]|uniref:Aminoglycoside phosphotransferase domain-containing protein n=1 Tax=Rhodobaculum claviforme TaxID=1549854 RepID=A0A934TNG7_9RHOB|nr:bifunctional aminoglycoside phosphotransferase/ATP-binding protein [Rhodobaculum claviforme]MBK5928884.1 hypothetical protein [Rhodobaculum claviforme]